MTTQFVFFPFDLFGSAGAAGGVELLADEIREILDDNDQETVPTRAEAYAPHVHLIEENFDTMADYQQWRQRGHELVRECAKNDDFLFWITGNHLGALPVYEEIARWEVSTLVVQLDAHLDVHHFANCSKEPSHGNFLMHVEGTLPPIVNVGNRELLLPRDHVEQYFESTWSAVDLVCDAGTVLEELASRCEQAEKILLDLDCDCFDPTFFPAVKRPVPMGLTPQQVLAILEAVWSEKIAGVIVSEFAPDCDQNDRSLATITWLIEHLLLKKYES